jgi:hypothetical protein
MLFFILLCIILYLVIAFKLNIQVPYGWLMLVAFGWFMGFLDGRRSMQGAHRDQAFLPKSEDDAESSH